MTAGLMQQQKAPSSEERGRPVVPNNLLDSAVPFIEAGLSAYRWPSWQTEADPRLVCGAP